MSIMSSAVAGGGGDPWGSRAWGEDRAVATEEAAAEGIDHFDQLPDSVLLVIFNLIGDVKALGRCGAVSRRFHALVPLVDYVVVRVDCVISDDPSAAAASPSDKTRGVLSHLARLLLGGLVRPLQALGHILGPAAAAAAAKRSPPSASEVSHHSPTEVLKSFHELRRLEIELPSGELGVDDGVLLKWKASFGSTLDSCVILGASSVLSSPKSPEEPCGNGDDSRAMPESFYTNGGLKLRVVWTISSLIAASARHYLLQPIIADHHDTLESLDLTDTDGQGVLTMDKRQLQELRVRPVSSSRSTQRTLVPALSMRLWYAPQLELPGGVVLKGATLVAIRPSEERIPREAVGGQSDGCWFSNTFEEPYRTAARMLMKGRNYCLEMNSF